MLRPVATGLARRAATTTTTTSTTTTLGRQACFSTTTARKAGAHGPQYDPPGGWLWGIRPGEKPKKEGWEGLFYYGYCGSLVVFAIAYAFKPDTSIQTWALEEARRRLEVEGILEDPDNKK